MSKALRSQLGHAFVVVTVAASAAACTETTPVGPAGSPAPEALAAAPAAAIHAGAATPGAAAAERVRAPDLGVCENLNVPAGSKLAFRVYAEGVQIYHWNGTSWSFDGPLAELYADRGANGTVGIHYAGPTWESNSGGKVIGAVQERCTPDAGSIAWLLLATVSTEGPGIFHRVSHIQRLNTVGGNPPAHPGTFIGEEARVPYTTDYLFYRAR